MALRDERFGTMDDALDRMFEELKRNAGDAVIVGVGVVIATAEPLDDENEVIGSAGMIAFANSVCEHEADELSEMMARRLHADDEEGTTPA